jgi:serine/threonine-protein kinase RsbW
MTRRLHGVADGRLRLQVPPDAVSLAAGQRAIAGFLAPGAASEHAVFFTELAFEELLSNIIRHGNTGGAPIDVCLTVRDDGAIELTVEDDGPPFDPLSVPEPPAPSSIEDARIGGLGLVLVRKSCERMTYERIAGRNRVSVRIAPRAA